MPGELTEGHAGVLLHQERAAIHLRRMRRG